MQTQTIFQNLDLITDPALNSGPATLSVSGRLTIPVYGSPPVLGTPLTISSTATQSDGFAVGNAIRTVLVSVTLASGTTQLRLLAQNAVAGSIMIYRFTWPDDSTAAVQIIDDASSAQIVNVEGQPAGYVSCAALFFDGTSWSPLFIVTNPTFVS